MRALGSFRAGLRSKCRRCGCIKTGMVTIQIFLKNLKIHGLTIQIDGKTEATQDDALAFKISFYTEAIIKVLFLFRSVPSGQIVL